MDEHLEDVNDGHQRGKRIQLHNVILALISVEIMKNQLTKDTRSNYEPSKGAATSIMTTNLLLVPMVRGRKKFSTKPEKTSKNTTVAHRLGKSNKQKTTFKHGHDHIVSHYINYIYSQHHLSII